MELGRLQRPLPSSNGCWLFAGHVSPETCVAVLAASMVAEIQNQQEREEGSTQAVFSSLCLGRVCCPMTHTFSSAAKHQVWVGGDYHESMERGLGSPDSTGGHCSNCLPTGRKEM